MTGGGEEDGGRIPGRSGVGKASGWPCRHFPRPVLVGAMKPARHDHRHVLRISGDQLRELKRHTGEMAEAFGLDRKIERYAGVRPITFYRWDLDCLIDVIDLALRDKNEYPSESSPEYRALAELGDRLRREYQSVYRDEG